jgi:hypothetical protein
MFEIKFYQLYCDLYYIICYLKTNFFIISSIEPKSRRKKRKHPRKYIPFTESDILDIKCNIVCLSNKIS